MRSFVDFETLRRSLRPNSALIAPDGMCQNAKIDAVSPRFDQSAADLWAALLDLVSQTSNWKVKFRDDENMRLKLVAVTPLMRFRDDVDVQVLADGAHASQLAIYSRSRVGYSDLGKNLKRANAIVESLRSK